MNNRSVMYPEIPHGLMKLQASSDTTATEPPTLNPKRNADTKTRVSSSFTPGRSARRRFEPTINAEKAATIARLRALCTLAGSSSQYLMLGGAPSFIPHKITYVNRAQCCPRFVAGREY